MIESGKELSYIILYEFDKCDPNSKGFLRCKNLKQLFQTITKIGMNICISSDQKSNLSFKKLLSSLKTIPFLKVYQTTQNIGQLTQVQNFCNIYRQYIKQGCQQTESIYELIKQAFKSKEYLQNYIKSLIQKDSVVDQNKLLVCQQQQMNQENL